MEACSSDYQRSGIWCEFGFTTALRVADEVEFRRSRPSGLALSLSCPSFPRKREPRIPVACSWDDEFGCQQGLLTASFPLEDGEGELVDKLYINYYIDNISNA
jgi:hypothetical protein